MGLCGGREDAVEEARRQEGVYVAGRVGSAGSGICVRRADGGG